MNKAQNVDFVTYKFDVVTNEWANIEWHVIIDWRDDEVESKDFNFNQQ